MTIYHFDQYYTLIDWYECNSKFIVPETPIIAKAKGNSWCQWEQ
jgi:hypothetical protein